MIDENIEAFAEACVEMDTYAQLQEAIKGRPDRGDMEVWDLSADGWFRAIEIAMDIMERYYVDNRTQTH